MSPTAVLRNTEASRPLEPDEHAGGAPTLYQGGCTAHQVKRLSRTLVRVYDQAMEPTGMTVGQFSILRSLRRAALTQGQLARDLGCERTTLSRSVRPLIERGWVVPTRAADARVQLLSLSDQGVEHLRTTRLAWRRVQASIDERFGRDQIRAMHEAMEKMRIVLEQQLVKEPEHDA